jgi:hypothetical protein
MIDRIEFHVGKAVEYVKAGTEDTRKALKLQREARKVRHSMTFLSFRSVLIRWLFLCSEKTHDYRLFHHLSAHFGPDDLQLYSVHLSVFPLADSVVILCSFTLFFVVLEQFQKLVITIIITNINNNHHNNGGGR